MPRAQVFDDFGGVALGRLGRWLVYCTVYLTIFTEPIVFHLTRRAAAPLSLPNTLTHPLPCCLPTSARGTQLHPFLRPRPCGPLRLWRMLPRTDQALCS